MNNVKSKYFYKGQKVFYKLAPLICPEYKNFIVSVDRGSYRCFISFESAHKFCEWYKTLEPNEKTINEVITSDIRKLILDIDNPDIYKYSIYDWKRHISARIRKVFYMLDIGNPEIISYNISSDNKLSYHFVVSNFTFTAKACAGLCMIISKDQIWKEFIDTGIYKNIQCIRIEDSTKFGENRWKRRMGKKENSLLDGLLSNLEGTSFSNIVCNIIQPICTFPKVCGKEIYKRCFYVAKVCHNTNTVFLRRTHPGFCSQCMRVHDKDNAMIKYINGQYKFMCWRFITVHQNFTRGEPCKD